MHELPYGFGKRLAQSNFDSAVASVSRSLWRQGFRVVTHIDVQQALQAKPGTEFRHYVILAACNPDLMDMALEIDPHIGLLLPCNVVVQEGHAKDLFVAAASPRETFQFTHDPQLRSIASEAERRLRRAVEDAA